MNKFEELNYVTSDDFSELAFMSSEIRDHISQLRLAYIKPSRKERDDIILDILKFLNQENIVTAGSERKQQWENGWNENLQEYLKSKNLDALVPKYFDKYSVQRLNGDFIVAKTKKFELEMVKIFQKIVFNKYFQNHEAVYEFGAGTGHNLLRMRQVNPNAKLYSMEWAKSGVELINKVAADKEDPKLFGIEFNNFYPNHDIKLDSNCGIYTFAALEQLSTNTDSLIEYWIDNKPNIVVNIEPIAEILDTSELLQSLSVRYFEKRNYLKNYLKKLEELENSGRIIIHDKIRTGIGSKYIEGYSIVAWSPK